MIGIDGCFLKGVLVTAIGRDENGQMYPIAWAVVESENLEAWRWFIELLQKDLELHDGQGFTIISDQHPSIISVVRTVIPTAEHRFCVRHLFCNWAKKFKGDEVKIQYWNCVRATCVRCCPN